MQTNFFQKTHQCLRYHCSILDCFKTEINNTNTTTVSNNESTLEVCGMQPVRKQKVQAIFWADEFAALDFSFYCNFNLY